ncbi:hypothetical protein GEMRC1_004275 [Eukaryota sp. GEM-RC1]
MSDSDLQSFVSSLSVPKKQENEETVDVLANVMTVADEMNDEVEVNHEHESQQSELERLMSFISQWMAMNYSRTVGARLLTEIVQKFGFELLHFPNIRPFLISTLPYLQKHFDKMSKLFKNSHIVDGVLSQCLLSSTDNQLVQSKLIDDRFSDVSLVENVFTKISSLS